MLTFMTFCNCVSVVPISCCFVLVMSIYFKNHWSLSNQPLSSEDTPSFTFSSLQSRAGVDLIKLIKSLI